MHFVLLITVIILTLHPPSHHSHFPSPSPPQTFWKDQYGIVVGILHMLLQPGIERGTGANHQFILHHVPTQSHADSTLLSRMSVHANNPMTCILGWQHLITLASIQYTQPLCCPWLPVIQLLSRFGIVLSTTVIELESHTYTWVGAQRQLAKVHEPKHTGPTSTIRIKYILIMKRNWWHMFRSDQCVALEANQCWRSWIPKGGWHVSLQ